MSGGIFAQISWMDFRRWTPARARTAPRRPGPRARLLPLPRSVLDLLLGTTFLFLGFEGGLILDNMTHVLKFYKNLHGKNTII